MKNELEKLKQCFCQEELDDSWYYIALQYLNNESNQREIEKKKNVKKINEEDLDSIELENIKESRNIVDPNLLSDWLIFILTYKNNQYFSNIIKKTIYIVKQIAKDNFFDESLINQLNLSSFELTMSQNIINKFFINKINLFTINDKKNNVIKMI